MKKIKSFLALVLCMICLLSLSVSAFAEETESEAPQLIKRGIISGGMIPKIDCCVDAVRNGVSRTHILDGRIPHSILIEMLTDSGVGTMIW